MSKHEILEKLMQAVLMGEEDQMASLVEEARQAGASPMDIIKEGMSPGAKLAGDKFDTGEYFLPELMMSGEAMKAGLEVLLPHMTTEMKAQSEGKVLFGSVEGDVHDIGKNIVISMLTASGFEVVDLGIDVPADTFIEKVEEEKPNILGMGAYMSTTLPEMKTVMQKLQEKDLLSKVKVMVGGVATTAKFAEDIGADGHAEDASKAVKLAQNLMEG